MKFIDRCGIKYEDLRENAKITTTMPFSSSRKRMSNLNNFFILNYIKVLCLMKMDNQ